MNQTNNNKNCCGRLPNGQGWGHSGSCEDQTNNRIREEWREELAEIIFQIQRCPKQYRTCLNCKEALENHIAELLKSQREELLEKIEEKFKEYQNDSEILAKNCIFRTGMGKEDIINLIK